MQIVSNEDFVRAWESSRSVDEVSQQIGLATATIHARANKLRNRGVPLHYMYHGHNGQRLDVAALRQLLAELRGVSVEDIQRDAQARAAASKARREARRAKATPSRASRTM